MRGGQRLEGRNAGRLFAGLATALLGSGLAAVSGPCRGSLGWNWVGRNLIGLVWHGAVGL